MNAMRATWWSMKHRNSGVFAGLFVLFASFWMLATGCKKQDSQHAVPNAVAASASPRVAVLSPAAAIIVRDLGFEKNVVARHAYDAVLAKELPSAGDQAGINYEMLLRVDPTLVITQWGARTLPEKLMTLARERNWTVLDVNPLTLEQIADATTKIGAALSSDEAVVARASELAARVRECGVVSPRNEAELNRGAAKSSLSVLMLVGVSPITALGPGSCHYEMLVGAGATPALKEGLAFQTLTSEDLIRLAPDAILLFDPKPSDAASVGSNEAARGDVWKPLRELKLEAVASGRVAVIDDPLCLMPSTSMIGVSKEMRRCVERWILERSRGE